MKRIKYLAVLLLTVGVLGLTGCGSSSADVGVQEPTEIADESQAEAETDDENAEGEDAGNETDTEDHVQNPVVVDMPETDAIQLPQMILICPRQRRSGQPQK